MTLRIKVNVILEEVCDLINDQNCNLAKLKILISKLPNLDRKTWGPLRPDSQEPILVRNPLQVAVMEAKSVKMVTFLVQNGFFVDALWQGVCRTFAGQRIEIRGLNSLSCAIARHDVKMVQTLVQLGADVNLQIPCYSFYNGAWHYYYTTPLLTSVEMSNSQIVQTLFKLGANLKLRAVTSAGGELDCMTLAEQRQDFSILKALQKESRKLKSLQDLCRIQLRSQIQFQSLDFLQISNCLIDYLKFKN